jgi:hypothetical protein
MLLSVELHVKMIMNGKGCGRMLLQSVLRPGIHEGNWKLELGFNYSHFSVESQLLLECVYTEETGSLLVAQ